MRRFALESMIVLPNKAHEGVMKENNTPKLVFLTGLSGAGKSTVGEELGRLLEFTFIDSDELIVAREGRSIKAIFESCGERGFRRVESEVIQVIVSQRQDSDSKGAVIALGGGALLSEANAKLVLDSGALVYLEITCKAAAERLLSHTDRPLTLGVDGEALSQGELTTRLEKLLESRISGYESADYTVSTTSRSVSSVCHSIRDYIIEKR